MQKQLVLDYKQFRIGLFPKMFFIKFNKSQLNKLIKDYSKITLHWLI